MDMENQRQLRRRLREWDPARRLREPAETRWQRARQELAAASAERHRPLSLRSPAWLTAACAAALIAAFALAFAVRGPGVDSGSEQPAEAVAGLGQPMLAQTVADKTVADNPLQLQLVASNGTRIYWSIPQPTRSQRLADTTEEASP